MKIRLALFALSIFALSVNVPAQTSEAPGSYVKTTFDTWRSTQQPSTDSHPAFFAVEAERLDSTSATLTAGVASFGDSFTLTVKPLKVEMGADGKFVQTAYAVAATIGTGPTDDRETFATPTLTFKVPADANAIEISLRLGRNASPITTTIKLEGKTHAQIASR
ncbi:MAG: hypothetical protein ABJA02_04330 [Acidobacteriota bacterium]